MTHRSSSRFDDLSYPETIQLITDQLQRETMDQEDILVELVHSNWKATKLLDFSYRIARMVPKQSSPEYNPIDPLILMSRLCLLWKHFYNKKVSPAGNAHLQKRMGLTEKRTQALYLALLTTDERARYF